MQHEPRATTARATWGRPSRTSHGARGDRQGGSRARADQRKIALFAPTVHSVGGHRGRPESLWALRVAHPRAMAAHGAQGRPGRRSGPLPTAFCANCTLLTEGFDEPAVDCVIVARPTEVPGALHPDRRPGAASVPRQDRRADAGRGRGDASCTAWWPGSICSARRRKSRRIHRTNTWRIRTNWTRGSRMYARRWVSTDHWSRTEVDLFAASSIAVAAHTCGCLLHPRR